MMLILHKIVHLLLMLQVTNEDETMLYILQGTESRIWYFDLRKLEFGKLCGASQYGGYKDGALDKAEFDTPCGLAYRNGLLYVSEHGNRCVREIDLKKRTVRKIAGVAP